MQLQKMSLRIIKPGVLDTVQDGGRYGFQHLGINPGGAMDRFAAQTANLLAIMLMKPSLKCIFLPQYFYFNRKR
jgi:antagonist of KipI